MSVEKTPHNEDRLLKILLRPHVSEKTTLIADKFRYYTFEVAKCANKQEIKKAVEHLFKVEVESVRVLNNKGKRKVFRQRAGRRDNWKKAYVRLKPGHDIAFTGAE